jgi:hypothetical protein
MLDERPRKLLGASPSRNIALRISMAHYEASLDRARTLNELKHDIV